METQILGNIIGGVIAGVVCGVFPLINGITKNQSRLALCGFFVSLVLGIIAGILLAIPCAMIYYFQINNEAKFAETCSKIE